MRSVARTWGPVLAAAVLVLSGTPSAHGGPMASVIVGVYATVKGDGPAGNPNTQMLQLSNGFVVSFGPNGPPVPPGILVSPLEVQFFGTAPTHVALFVPGNTSAQTLTLSSGATSVVFDIEETTTLPTFRTDPVNYPHTLFFDTTAELESGSGHVIGGIDLSPFVGTPAHLLIDVVNTDVTFPSGTPTFTFTGVPVSAFSLAVPEPSAFFLWAAGAGAVGLLRRRLSRASAPVRPPRG